MLPHIVLRDTQSLHHTNEPQSSLKRNHKDCTKAEHELPQQFLLGNYQSPSVAFNSLGKPVIFYDHSSHFTFLISHNHRASSPSHHCFQQFSLKVLRDKQDAPTLWFHSQDPTQTALMDQPPLLELSSSLSKGTESQIQHCKHSEPLNHSPVSNPWQCTLAVIH